MDRTADPSRPATATADRSAVPADVPSNVPPFVPVTFHERIYRGDIIEIEGLAAFAQLIAHARALVEEALHPWDPQRLHEHMDETQQRERLGAIQRAFAGAAETRRLWTAVLEALGLDPARIACDRLHLRFQPHRDPDQTCGRHPATATVAFHRDTWGSNLYAQTNWWAPIHPVTAGRTVALYPDLWATPLPNTSAHFDMATVLARSRAGGRTAVGADESIPHLSSPIDTGTARPVLAPPGTLIAFSGAHAHAGVGNHTGLTRISFETRTVWVDDLLARRGAPNIDGQAPWAAPGLFRMLADGRPLNEVLGCGRTVQCADWPLAIPVATP